VWHALLEADLAASPLSKLLLALRGYGRRARRATATSLPVRIERFGFARLDEDPGRELVFGLAGRFWRPDGDLRRIAGRDAFLAFSEEGSVKAAWNLAIADAAGSGCELTTETRVRYFGASARRRFRIYWFLIRPFSGALRRSLLRDVRRRAEGAR
jgi:hypothetical protein